MTTISPEQAADALHDIAETQNRATILRGYQQGSPHLFLWGCVWIAGYLATGLMSRGYWAWMPLVLIGIAGSALLGPRQRRAQGTAKRVGRQIWQSWIVLALFWVATYVVLKPHAANQFAAFPALFMGVIYSVVGIVWLPRYLVLGLGVSALTLVGYFLIPESFALWMAAVGGGGLVLGGLWLRKA